MAFSFLYSLHPSPALKPHPLSVLLPCSPVRCIVGVRDRDLGGCEPAGSRVISVAVDTATQIWISCTLSLNKKRSFEGVEIVCC